MMGSSAGKSAAEIEEWLVERLSVAAGVSVDVFDIQLPFVDYQIDSSVAVTLAFELSEWLGVELPVTVFWEYPSVLLLSEVLGTTSAAREPAPICT